MRTISSPPAFINSE